MPEDRRENDRLYDMMKDVHSDVKGISGTLGTMQVDTATRFGKIDGDIKELQSSKVPWSVVRIGGLVSIGLAGIGAVLAFLAQ